LKIIEIYIRHLLLQLLLLIKKKESQSTIPKFGRNSKILFIRLNRIGDALVTTPLLSELKRQTGSKIYILAGSKNYFIFENPEICDEVIVHKKGFNSQIELIRSLNSIGFDAIVDLHDDISTTVSYLIAFVKCNYKFGLSKGIDKLFTHTIQRLDPEKYHVVDRMLEFGKLFNLKNNQEKINIVFSPAAEAEKNTDKFLKDEFTQKRFLVGINISAGHDARFWGVENFKKLISILNNYDINLVLLCDKKNLQSATNIAGDAVPVYHRDTFNDFSAIINKLDFLFTPDTSIIHVASAFMKPVFGIYVKYNTKDMIWSPYKSPFECVITEEPNLNNVSFESVKEKFIPFFEKFYYGSKSKNM
jgi:ADP-heptose:LPS heptosyltransferase